MDDGAAAGAGRPALTPRGARSALWLTLLIATAVVAAADPAAWLQRMREALQQLHYQGTLVHVRDGQLDAMQVWHRADATEPRQRMQALTGEPRELLRHGTAARLKAGPGLIPAPAPNSPAADDAGFDDPWRHYVLGIVGTDRVAGRATTVIELRPRDDYRFGYRLWLDQQLAFPLKSIAFGADGRPVEQWMFTDIRLGAAPADDELGEPLPQSAPPATADAPQPAAASRWSVADLPPGFRALGRIGSGQRGEHLLFGDGLASVSLYIEPLDADAPNLSGVLQRGATSLFGRVLGGHQITAVGDVPPATVARIARGVTPDDAR